MLLLVMVLTLLLDAGRVGQCPLGSSSSEAESLDGWLALLDQGLYQVVPASLRGAHTGPRPTERSIEVASTNLRIFPLSVLLFLLRLCA